MLKLDDIILDPELIEFGTNAYKNFDKSHDFNHALKVLGNCDKIINYSTCNPAFVKTVAYTAILHDAIDYKYEKIWSVTPIEIMNFLLKNLDSYSACCAYFTITHMSWSKRKKLDIYDKYFNHDLFYIVQDADWIEAIDVQRCIDYSIMIGREVPGGVISHIEEKLMHILPNLHFDVSKKIAQPLHEKLMEYYVENKTEVLVYKADTQDTYIWKLKSYVDICSCTCQNWFLVDDIKVFYEIHNDELHLYCETREFISGWFCRDYEIKAIIEGHMIFSKSGT